MSDSKVDVPAAVVRPEEIPVPGSPSSKGESEQTPTYQSVAESSTRPLIDVDVVPEDPSAEALELIVPRSGNDGDSKQSFDETEPLLPPPEFTDYVAEHYVDGKGNIISHDHHLNEDGEALYRFLLEHASTRPSLLINCHGYHTEWRTRQVTKYENGKNITSTESYSERIVDFDFTLDLSDSILSDPDGAPIWIAGDKDAVHRGRRKLEVDSPPKVSMDRQEAPPLDVELGYSCDAPKSNKWRRRATEVEQSASESWRSRRGDYGYAPWVLIRGQIRGMEASVDGGSENSRNRLSFTAHSQQEGVGQWYDDSVINPPSKTLRDWADEYCASKRYLKQFNFEKVAYGWNMAALKQAIEATVRNNYAFQGDLKVTVSLEGNSISIQPDNWFSRMLNKTWIVVLLWIFLIYPLVIWPFWKFSSRGGGSWEVAGSAFALCKWVHLPDSAPGETVEEYEARCGTAATSSTQRKPLLKATPKGISQLVGKREGEWFQAWEETIGSLVRQRYQSELPLSEPLGSDRTIGIGLAGYYPERTRNVLRF